MNPKAKSFIFLTLCLLSSLTLYGFYISVAEPLVPYMDTMLFFVQLDKILSGEITWLQAYGSGEHRGLIYPFITLLEWIFWGADARITTVLTGVVVAAIFSFWLRVFLLAYHRDIDQKVSLSLCAFIAICASYIIVSPAAFELWTLSLGFAQLVKNLLVISFFYQLAFHSFWRKNILGAFVLGLWGGFLILFATYGWSYPFFAAVIFMLICILRAERHLLINCLIIVLLMAVAQAVYIYAGRGILSGESTQGAELLTLIKGVLYGAGTSFIGAEVIAKTALPVFIPMLLGGALLLVVAVALLRALIAPTPINSFAGALLIFALVVLLGVTLARGATIYENTGASRYFVDYVWLVLAPLLIFSRRESVYKALPIQQPWLLKLPLEKIWQMGGKLMLLLFFAASLGHLATWYVELKTAPYRALSFEKMASVYRHGVTSQDDASLLQSPFDTARKAIEVAQRYNLSSLRYEKPKCSLDLIDFVGDWFAPEQNYSRWMGRNASISISRCAKPITLHFFIPKEFPARQLQVSYDNLYQTVMLEPGKAVSVTLPETANRYTKINFAVDSTSNPFSLGLNDDKRDLGLLLTFAGN